MNPNELLIKNPLFAGMNEADIASVLNCLGSRKQTFPKGDFIFLAGQSEPAVGILLSGRAQVIRENQQGDSMIVGTIEAGDMFGETYACMELPVIPVSVAAETDCEVLLFSVSRLVRTCPSACAFHHRLIANLMHILAQKNARLNRKMSYITHKTIRGRLEAYFEDLMEQSGSSAFTVPFNRNGLSDYLCIDRSALSRELSRMKEEGILEYKGNHFCWLEK